jgi:hypothetical protein
MTIYVDYINKNCFIVSPKCGTQSISNYSNTPLNITYTSEEIERVLKDSKMKKIIVTRDIISRFVSGFYEDLHNNDCYLNLNISFFDYIIFIFYCYENKIKNVNNLNVFYRNKNNLIEWGQCSSEYLPITDSSGNISGHIVHQGSHIEPIMNMLDKNDNVEVIDISELNKFIETHKNQKLYNTNINNKNYNFNTLLSELKKDNVSPSKEKMINPLIENIINHIYQSDYELIKKAKSIFNK